MKYKIISPLLPKVSYFSRCCLPIFHTVRGALLFSKNSKKTPSILFSKLINKIYIPGCRVDMANSSVLNIIFWKIIFYKFSAF